MAGLRDRRLLQTAQALSSAARRLTVERGLNGFTIEDLCDLAAVSRRTFFNYYSSKEDAVLGRSSRRSDERATQEFLTSGPPGVPTAGDDTWGELVDDLAALHAARWRTLDITRETIAEVRSAIDREPQLLSRLVELSQLQEAVDIDLVAQREGLPPDDLRIRIAVQLVGALARSSAWDILEAAPVQPTPDFADLMRLRLQAARAVLGSTPLAPATPPTAAPETRA